jgi:outer membrane cobalamin receptor
MKLRWLLIVSFFSFASFAQPAQHYFACNDAKLERVLADIEQQFDIRYSYVADIIAPKKVTLAAGDYTLEAINAAISMQTGLIVAKIDDRYYALSIEQEPPVTILEEIIVDGFLSKGINKSARNFTLSPRKIEELPGITDADVLFSLQQLPGVKSPNETASGLHIRGGTPDQNLVLWDGIRMYHPGHLFGMISGFNPNIAQTVNFYSKATSPKFGERTSGIIDIRTDNGVDSLRAEAGINGLSADAYVKIPLTKELGLQLSGRKSYTEWLQTPTFDALAEKVFQNTNFDQFDQDNQFGFQDYAAKIYYAPTDSDRFAVSGIAIDNHLDYFSGSDGTRRNQKMDVRNYGFSGNWQHDFGKVQQEIVLYYSAYTFNYENNRRYPDSNFEWFVKKNRVTDSGAELNYSYAIRDNVIANFGYQLSGNDLSHIFLDRFPGLEVELGQKHLMNVSHAGYADFQYSPGPWVFQTGARYNYFNRLKESSLEPRALIQCRFSNLFTAQLSYERKSQIVSQIRESVANDLSLENYVWILSDGNEYPVQRANQFTAGVTYKNKSFLIDADAYYKTIDGVTSMAFGLLHEYDSEVHRGDGFTKGFDLLVQKSAATWRIWLTYTYQDSQNRYEGLNSGDGFPISSDIRHALTLSFYKKWNRFSASAGWFWHTGKPYSRLDSQNQINSFNDERLPEYHRLDLSAAYDFKQNKSWSGKVGMSILNVYNRHSHISREYERQATSVGELFETDYSIRDYTSLGFTPNVFVRIYF